MNPNPLCPITDAEVETFRTDGVVCLRGQFDAGWIDQLRRALEIARTRPGPNAQDHTVAGEQAGFFSDLYISRRVPEMRAFVHGSPAGAIVARLLESSRVNFLHDAMWVKEAGTSRRTPWHHDQPFYCAEGEKMCVLWLPLDPVSRDLSLECVAGSHRWGRRFRPERVNGGWYDGYDETDGFDPPPEVDKKRDQLRVLGWDMEPGDCVVFHAMTVHGAPGALTGKGRRAISLVLLGDDMVYVDRGRETQPSYQGCGLVPGDPMDCDYFPRLWPRAEAGPPA